MAARVGTVTLASVRSPNEPDHVVGSPRRSCLVASPVVLLIRQTRTLAYSRLWLLKLPVIVEVCILLRTMILDASCYFLTRNGLTAP